MVHSNYEVGMAFHLTETELAVGTSVVDLAVLTLGNPAEVALTWLNLRTVGTDNIRLCITTLIPVGEVAQCKGCIVTGVDSLDGIFPYTTFHEGISDRSHTGPGASETLNSLT